MSDSPSKESVSPVRFAILGCGRVAPTHWQALASMPEKAKLVAVCDNKAEHLSAAVSETGAEGVDSLEELLRRPDVDVISICTPSGVHGEHGVKVAAAGKHVLVEKPMDVSREAADRLIAACDQSGVNLYCVFQNRLNSTLQLVKSALDAGRFGKLVGIQATVVWRRTDTYYASDSWRGTRSMDGGAFMNQGIHFVDAMRFLFGEIRETRSLLATLARKMECEDTGAALFRFDNGAIGSILVTMMGHRDEEGSLTVVGDKGTVHIGGVAMNRIERWDFVDSDPDMDARARSEDIAVKSVYGTGHTAYYHQVVQHLTGHGPRPTGGKDGLASLRAILDIYDA